MLRYILAIGGAFAAFVFVASLAFVVLANSCSSPEPLIKAEGPMKPEGANKNAENSESGEQRAAPNDPQRTKPSGTFELQITVPNKIEGRYYREKSEGDK